MTWYCQAAMHFECDSAEVADDHRKFRERSLEFLFSHNSQQELHIRWRQDIVAFYTQHTTSEPLIPQSGCIVLLGKLAQATLTHDLSKFVPRHGGPFAIEIFGANELFSWAVNPDTFPPTPQYGSSCDRSPELPEWRPGELEGSPYPVWVFFMAYYREDVYIYRIILTRPREHDATYQRAGLAIFRLRDERDDIERILGRWDDQQVAIL
ncbi:hypothetical protein F4776DRAFT_619067 [Hypoxylon sp. NC0597]|nr:hypothetical protein F4776DRAFT_619067 [Hypoxylon sp. NC0597]